MAIALSAPPMPASHDPATNFCGYRFGRFVLFPSKRELWEDGRQKRLPRRIFDCLCHLLECRDRAVGRDELVAVLWKHSVVSDKQVNQLIVRTRRALGDDGNAQATIRTVAGFGYRWAMEVERVATNDARPDDDTAAPDVAAGSADETGRPAQAAPSPDGRMRRSRLVAILLMAMLTIAIVGFALRHFVSAPPSAPAAASGGPAPAGHALVVLPMEVDGAREDGWMRLGMMDLVADRLRGAGLPVPPSETVLKAIDATRSDTTDIDRLATTLGGDRIVHGRLSRTSAGWRIELDTASPDGVRHQVQSERAEVTEAARTAADLLLASLGHLAPADAREQDGTRELMQQAQAAMLANEFELARDILHRAAQSDANDPEVRFRLTEIDLRESKLDDAEAALTAMVSEPAVRERPLLHARVLNARGSILLRREKCPQAESDYTAAVAALEGSPRAPALAEALAGRGLARTCQHTFDASAADLGQARAQFEASGDRLGVARNDNYRGLLELERGRPADAVPYLLASADVYESFGAIDNLLFTLSGLFDAQALQLRWRDAWATSERGWRLRERVRDPEKRLLLHVDRLRALTALGRLGEARSLLEATDAEFPQPRDNVARYRHAAAAELAWDSGRHADAAAAATKVLAVWPAAIDAELRARMALLRQRASIESGQPAEAANERGDAATDRISPARLVAAAEWQAHEGDEPAAEWIYRDALRRAQDEGIPANIALVAQSFGGWLLERGRVDEAADLAGRVAVWADQDYDCALFKLEVFHAFGPREAWADALRAAQRLAGERRISAGLERPASF